MQLRLPGKADAARVRRARRARCHYRARVRTAPTVLTENTAPAPAAPAARHGYSAPQVLYCASVAVAVVVTETADKAGALQDTDTCNPAVCKVRGVDALKTYTARCKVRGWILSKRTDE